MTINPSTSFGQNEWLVEKMLEKFQADPDSVDDSWKAILAEYSPETKKEPTEKSKTNTKTTDKKVEKKTVDTVKETDKKLTIAKFGKEETIPLRGISGAVVKNMTSSLQVPTATSIRTVPAKALIENRITINEYLKSTRGGKISFTHIIGYALVQALKAFPNMNNYYQEIDGKPNLIKPAHINLGLAIDLPGKNGTRNLVVAAIKECENKSFAEFLTAYEEIVNKARNNKLTPPDFAGVTISLTNPGTLGTVSSVPRLMQKQGTIVGVGALEFPAEFQGTSEVKIADLAVGKIITLTSTYDHRIIQGAESGEFLRQINNLLLDDDFYDAIFNSLKIPYRPVRWRQDNQDKAIDKNAQVNKLIEAYRNLGHLIAVIDPLNSAEVKRDVTELDILNYGLTLWDLDRTFNAGFLKGNREMTLRQVLDTLRGAYCGRIGVEFTHILNQAKQNWIIEKIEAGIKKPDNSMQKYILGRLNAAEVFENFLQTKYIGQKRFSLEGAETLIPVLDAILETAAKGETKEVIIAMPHRGRLNVLANILDKPYKEIFTEFEGNQDPEKLHGSGDVKYHLGTTGTYHPTFTNRDITVSLLANPSHLEAVDPVLEGLTRAKQDLNPLSSYMPVCIHGDAAFAGQGIVAETLNLSKLDGYKTGGTIHVVVNNQIGFTTSPRDARSSLYCTDIAKTIGAPIFHVNGNDPEACVEVASLAVQYRETFHSDVIIDLVCYRKRGHNEGDDPTITQPVMYDKINSLPTVREIYTKNLVGRGDISLDEAELALQDYQKKLESIFKEVKELEKFTPRPSNSVEEEQKLPVKLVTAITADEIRKIGAAFTELPPGFTPNHKLVPVLERRKKMAEEGNIDWAFAELLVFGSLVAEGRNVRLSGQDAARGTFSQRQSIILDRTNGDKFSPISSLEKDQGKFTVVNSPLSEYAVLGFEYGYSLINTAGLTIWEAQFGDFVNGAQTVIDEYISSGEAKWNQLSDLVMLLPHSQEGQGPDHSSARVERFLQLCAESSMTVAWPSTPANYFHLLRRHVLDEIHRPLVVLTPKSMLRNKQAVSPLIDFTEGKFVSILDDPSFKDNPTNKAKVKRVIFTSGKAFYELYNRKLQDNRDDIAIVRIEQLYPIPHRRLAEAIKSYPNAKDIVWFQEEPINQGAWPYLVLKLQDKIPGLFDDIRCIARRSMSATSSGSKKSHTVEQQEIIDLAFS